MGHGPGPRAGARGQGPGARGQGPGARGRGAVGLRSLEIEIEIVLLKWFHGNFAVEIEIEIEFEIEF